MGEYISCLWTESLNIYQKNIILDHVIPTDLTQFNQQYCQAEYFHNGSFIIISVFVTFICMRKKSFLLVYIFSFLLQYYHGSCSCSPRQMYIFAGLYSDSPQLTNKT